MSGLETAIVLIAFSTVAAVFGYAVLSAGLFSSEKGKETVYAGLKQAKANIELSGSVIASAADGAFDPPPQVSTIKFTVRNSIASAPIDMTPNSGATAGQNRCLISLTTDRSYYNNIQWSVEQIGASNGNNLLEQGEQFEVTLDLTLLGGAGAFADPNLGPNDWFTIQIKPALGSTLTLQRTLPASLDHVMDLH